jgi:hypothetical protein
MIGGKEIFKLRCDANVQRSIPHEARNDYQNQANRYAELQDVLAES